METRRQPVLLVLAIVMLRVSRRADVLSMRRSLIVRALRVLGHRVVILAFTAFAVFPFYWMAITTFKQNSDLYVGASNTAHNPFLFNRPPTLEHLRTLFEATLFPTWLFNTLTVGLVVVAITLVLAVPAGYSLARLTGRWGERLSIGIFLTYLVPSTLLFIPFSRLVSLLGLQNSLASLVLIYFTVPFCTWLLMGFFKSLPKEVEESAMLRPMLLLDGLEPFEVWPVGRNRWRKTSPPRTAASARRSGPPPGSSRSVWYPTLA